MRSEGGKLRDEVMTLYPAGHETTILTLTWSWYLLSQHRHVEEKLASEWQHVLAGRTPTPRDERGQASSRASVIHQRCSAALASTRLSCTGTLCTLTLSTTSLPVFWFTQKFARSALP